MIVYAVPFRASETTNNWDACVKRLDRTLQSIFNPRNNAPFKCIIACNHIPESLKSKYDDRLEWIELQMPIPQSWIEMARDKFWKLLVIAVHIRALLEQQENPEAGIYVMPVDADDLLNYRIAAYCAAHPDEHGFVSKDGYVWQEGSSVLRIYPQMHTYCGSCNIIKMYRDDLPECIPFPIDLCHDGRTAGILNSRYPIRYDHNIMVERYRQIGKPFSTLPFRSTIYVRGTGDNISCIPLKSTSTSNIERDRFHPIAFLRTINIFQMKWIGEKVQEEFGVAF